MRNLIRGRHPRASRTPVGPTSHAISQPFWACGPRSIRRRCMLFSSICAPVRLPRAGDRTKPKRCSSQALQRHAEIASIWCAERVPVAAKRHETETPAVKLGLNSKQCTTVFGRTQPRAPSRLTFATNHFVAHDFHVLSWKNVTELLSLAIPRSECARSPNGLIDGS